ncbi:hypothetical protein J3R30DRAFT_3420693 [Lentinula aciculospora]|uniref:DUF6533 domain-containing protein n=1 Tax=Lentinula aciculospora TaxID=153920 RepID=A0A9W9AVU1_9AGAR|nr:hypothetical protein J3R30DRAFT_3420693 [Lentinula aciculospora]
MNSPSVFNPLFHAIHSSQVANASIVAALTVLLYDCLLTFDKEVKYIWKSRWTAPKILYLFAKYYGVAHLCGTLIISNGTNLSAEFCKNYLWWISLGGAIVFTTAINAFLGIRLYALYQSNRMVLVTVIFLIICEFVAEFWGSYRSVILETTVPIVDLEHLIPDIKQVFPECQFEQLPSLHFTLASYVPNLFVSGVFFCLMAYKCFKSAPWKMWSARPAHKSSQNSTASIYASSVPGNVIIFFLKGWYNLLPLNFLNCAGCNDDCGA